MYYNIIYSFRFFYYSRLCSVLISDNSLDRKLCNVYLSAIDHICHSSRIHLEILQVRKRDGEYIFFLSSYFKYHSLTISLSLSLSPYYYRTLNVRIQIHVYTSYTEFTLSPSFNFSLILLPHCSHL